MKRHTWGARYQWTCLKCNRKNNDGASHCWSCGAKRR